MTRALAAIAAVFFATVAPAATATPASATTYHGKWDNLQFPPRVWPSVDYEHTSILENFNALAR